MTYPYTCRSVLLSTLLREDSICRRWWLTERHTAGQVVENKRLQNIQPEWNIYTLPPLPSALESSCKRELRGSKSLRQWMTTGSCIFRYSRGAVHFNSQGLWHYAQHMHNLRLTLNMAVCEGHRIPLLGEELLAVINCWEREWQFSLRVESTKLTIFQ